MQFTKIYIYRQKCLFDRFDIVSKTNQHSNHKHQKIQRVKIMSKLKLLNASKSNMSVQKDLQDNTLRIMEKLLSSCRLCLTSFIDGQGIIDLFEDEGNDTRLYSAIAMDLTGLTITKDDMYPKHICESCATQLAIFDALRTSCQLSFKKLQAIVPLGMSIRDSRKQKLAAEYIFETDGNNDINFESDASFHDDEMLIQLCDYDPSTHDVNENNTVEMDDQAESNNLIELNIKTETNADYYRYEPTPTTVDHKNVQYVVVKSETNPKRKRSPKIPASERNLHCEICKITFNRVHDFTRHKMSHAGIKEFSCDLCFQQFTRRSHLNSHMMIHNEIKPFSCGTCGFMFRKLSNLHRHMSVHSDQYNFECSLCEKKFKRMPSLRLHQKIHEGGFSLSCNICGKVYASYSGFKKHIAKHSITGKTEDKSTEQVEVLYEEYLITEDVEAIES